MQAFQETARRTVTRSFSMTAKEFSMLRDAADRAGVSLAAVVRRALAKELAQEAQTQGK